jgi:hypothetical protein
LADAINLVWPRRASTSPAALPSGDRELIGNSALASDALPAGKAALGGAQAAHAEKRSARASGASDSGAPKGSSPLVSGLGFWLLALGLGLRGPGFRFGREKRVELENPGKAKSGI